MRSSRRGFLGQGLRAVAAGGLVMQAAPAMAAFGYGQRRLSLDHLHTNERLSLVYAVGEDFLPQSISRLNYFLRDHYTGIPGDMDPRLYDIMHQVRGLLATNAPFEIISGYRSPATNERLRTTRGGGVAKQSLHTQGKAVDIRMTGVPLAELRDAAKSLQAGGVGYYPRDNFVHIDTGRVRYW
ncbi:DUF882 domain-containing protein [Brachymonas sp. G13]|uniref:YcbK family protein n=1 Tax=Brachymonas TaxID=28219 RepID=UPI0016966AB0|nr:DUF882 domain-containing protein [Brachymonas sp. J145]MEE1654261.1 DUF882 domain-containing protein [Brachymonas sp. J145]NLX16281.1 DUF882 domain-containing protein [Ramlibacter sp.]